MFLGDFASCHDYASKNELHEQLEDITSYTPQNVLGKIRKRLCL